jgi:hypothetical protein
MSKTTRQSTKTNKFTLWLSLARTSALEISGNLHTGGEGEREREPLPPFAGGRGSSTRPWEPVSLKTTRVFEHTNTRCVRAHLRAHLVATSAPKASCATSHREPEQVPLYRAFSFPSITTANGLFFVPYKLPAEARSLPCKPCNDLSLHADTRSLITAPAPDKPFFFERIRPFFRTPNPKP